MNHGPFAGAVQPDDLLGLTLMIGHGMTPSKTRPMDTMGQISHGVNDRPMPMPFTRPHSDRSLRIGLLGYRSDPHCGGQGVYLDHLSRSLTALGHRVEVITGPPAPNPVAGVAQTHLPSLDLYHPDHLFRTPSIPELAHPVNLVEWLGVITQGFPEPYTFGLRAYAHIRRRLDDFDLIHDNQSLSYGIWMLSRRIPTLATIHHPISVDRKIALSTARGAVARFKQWRWYSFVTMQQEVARTLKRIVTVSESARSDLCHQFGIRDDRISVVPNGIDVDVFRPLPGIPRDPNHVVVTTSADTPLKGLGYLLKAIALIARKQAIQLTVVGTPKSDGVVENMIRNLEIASHVRFTGRIAATAFPELYARATVAVVPSVYEGFGLPVGEAMACAVPVVSTTGGALPEVVGDAGILVPPADARALADAITAVLADPARAKRMGQDGFDRVHRHFTWDRAAQRMIAIYRRTIHDHHRQ